jgi:hypothetical protein
VLFVATLCTAACRSRSLSADRDAAAGDPVDRVFERYERDHVWIDPASGNEALARPGRNEGSVATCAHCDYPVCYEAPPIEDDLVIRRDEDLVRWIRWLRAPDPCVRRVAEHALSTRFGTGAGGLSVSVQDMHGLEYHALACGLRARLDAAKIPYEPSAFDGLYVALAERDFAPISGGRWQSGDGRRTVDVTADSIGVRDAAAPGGTKSPAPPDRVYTDRVTEIRVSPACRFEVTGLTKDGAVRTYALVPVSEDVLWFAASNEGVGFASADPIFERLTKRR